MDFLDPNSGGSPVAPPRRHELAIETLKFLTPALGLALFLVGLNSKYPWLSKPWVLNSLIALGVLVLVWFAKPRFGVWARRTRDRKRDQLFIAENAASLRRLVERFAVFTSNHDTRSLIQIIRSAYSQNMAVVEQIITSDYIGSWFYCYREQLGFPAKALDKFLSQCREFSHVVQAFNTHYVLHAQRKLAVAKPLSDDSIAQLDEFREEYNAFLRDAELWAQGIANYLQSGGVTDHPTLWRLAPTNHFDRVRSFGRAKPVQDSSV